LPTIVRALVWLRLPVENLTKKTMSLFHKHRFVLIVSTIWGAVSTLSAQTVAKEPGYSDWRRAMLGGGVQFSDCGGRQRATGPSRRLVVVVPSMSQTTYQWKSLIERLEGEPGFERGTADWLCFDHGIQANTLGSVRTYAKTLAAGIDGVSQRRGGYHDIVLVGHSIGGLIVRNAYLIGKGWDPAVPVTPRPWADSVRRIALFASINRGTDVDAFGPIRTARSLMRFSPISIPTPHLIVQDLLRGSAYLANLRTAWLNNYEPYVRCRKRAGVSGGGSMDSAARQARDSTLGACNSAGREQAPILIQLLGTKDNVVSESDSHDVLTLENPQLTVARQVHVPDATHGNLYSFDWGSNVADRYAVIRSAFFETRHFVREDTTNFRPDTTTRHVVFLLHGIRATIGDQWQDSMSLALRNELKAAHQSDSAIDKTLEIIRPTYGYFSALRFIFPAQRRANVPLFTDQFTEAKAKYPLADISIIAHSNGTFIVGEGLKKVPAMRFTAVSLAGSVLPVDYPWDDRKLNGQVLRVRNDVASKDFPVAVLASGVRGLGQRDVGTGGFDGFNGSATKFVGWHNGGHGAAFDGGNKASIARFVLDLPDAKPDPACPCSIPAQLNGSPDALRRFSRLMPWILPPVEAFVVYKAGRSMFRDGQFSWKGTRRVILIGVPIFVGLDII
jgi:alpha-beta hydrolase superfamily lysophospholipase